MAVPGLEYLKAADEKPTPVAPPKAPELHIEPLEPLEPLEMSSESLGGITMGSGEKMDISSQPAAAPSAAFERIASPQEIKPTAPEAAAMFEKRDAAPAMPTEAPPAAPKPIDPPPAPTSEFLKMFPDARPD